ncbi:precorrin-3B synthase [Mycobacterium sp.]|uniref:precorrin-3B synthase n=1 Tax=Mycobacterium sp. TaxID=1785 RepID=UPI003D6C31E4
MPRTRADDACPGALQVHRAADGALARVRLPGGMIRPAQLAALASVSSRLGSGALELTARGNVQIRGITNAAALADEVAAAGLLPSATHERVRNIVASPLSGRLGGLADVRGWVGELDAAIQAEQALVTLPGRFWFGIDDGRGDVSGLGTDVGVHLLDDGAALLLAGRDTGVRLSSADVVSAMVTVAMRFVDSRGKAWRVAELDDPGALMPGFELSDARFTGGVPPPVGWIEQDDGRIALSAVVPLGVMPARVAEYLAALDAPLVITPWRSVLVCDLDEAVADTALRVLAPLGPVFDENSPWVSVSACVGSPGCARSAADVRADAVAAAQTGDAGTRRHFVGCERACGSPPTGEVLVATRDGYRVLRAQP